MNITSLTTALCASLTLEHNELVSLLTEFTTTHSFTSLGHVHNRMLWDAELKAGFIEWALEERSSPANLSDLAEDHDKALDDMLNHLGIDNVRL